MSEKNLQDSIYELLGDDNDGRTCEDIKDNACKEVPGNFVKLTAALFFTKISDALASAKVVLPWLLSSAGVPAFFLGMLVPLRESFSLIPQILLGSVIRKRPVRKLFFVSGAFLQGILLAVIALATLHVRGEILGWVVCGLLLLFSLSRGLCSIASKDVLGKTIPKPNRGKLTGWSASAAGFATCCIGAALFTIGKINADLAIVVLVAAAICAMLSALCFYLVNEYAGATDGADNAFSRSLQNFKLLKSQSNLRNFILVRSFLTASAMATPYLVAATSSISNFSRENSATDLANPASLTSFALFLLVAGFASLVSGPFWGKFSDKSSQKVLTVTAVATFFLCLAASLVHYLFQQHLFSSSISLGLILILFFLFSVVHQGIRLGRKTYIVNIANTDNRATFVALSNTVIGLVLISFGAISAAVANSSVTGVFILFAASCITAAVLSRKLKDV